MSDTNLSKQATWTVYMHIVPLEISGYENDKIYVGITSQPVNQRWQNGKGYNRQLFGRAVLKYGWENINHVIVADKLEQDDAYAMEQHLIQVYNTQNPKYGYNISSGGDGAAGIQHFGETNPFYGKHHSEETKKKLSASSKRFAGENNPMYGKHHSEESKKKMSINRSGKCCGKESPLYGTHMSDELKEKLIVLCSKPVYQYDTELNFIGKYKSIAEASRISGIKRENIARAAHKIGYTAGGYYWIKEEDYISEEDIRQKINAYNKASISQSSNPVLQFDRYFNFIQEFSSIHEASRQTNISRSIISQCCKGKCKQSDDFIWRFAPIDSSSPISFEDLKIVDTPRKPVIAYSIQGETIKEYPNIKTAAADMHISAKDIRRVLREEIDNYKNIVWRYKYD